MCGKAVPVQVYQGCANERETTRTSTDTGEWDGSPLPL
jgi:hypothetical protein